MLSREKSGAIVALDALVGKMKVVYLVSSIYSHNNTKPIRLFCVFANKRSLPISKVALVWRGQSKGSLAIERTVNVANEN